MMRGQKTICGAKTRSGACCRNLPMKNGRCRLHGGKNKGPINPNKLKGNQNAVGNKGPLSTGEYETMTWERLTEEERDYLRQRYDLQPFEQIEATFDMEQIRMARMMQRANGLDKDPMRYLQNLICLENAMSRVSGKMVRMITSMVEDTYGQPQKTDIF